MHRLAAKDPQAVKFFLSPGQAPNAPEGGKLLRQRRGQTSQTAKVPLLMARADESEENRQPATTMGFGSRSAAAIEEPQSPLAIQPRAIQETQRCREVVAVLQGSEGVHQPGVVANSAMKGRDGSGSGKAILAGSPASPN